MAIAPNMEAGCTYAPYNISIWTGEWKYEVPTSNVLCAARISTNSSFVSTTFEIINILLPQGQLRATSRCELGGASGDSDRSHETALL